LGRQEPHADILEHMRRHHGEVQDLALQELVKTLGISIHVIPPNDERESFTLFTAGLKLRTPLLVLQGYVDMMVKGMAGALTPAMQRYLERMSRASGELNARLQQLLPVEDAPAEDLRPLLRATFGPGRRGSAALELPDGPVRVRAPRPVLELLIRTLGRLLAGAGASDMVLRVEAQDGAQWRVLVQARVERTPPERTRELLEKLTRRVQGQLTVRESAGWELTVLLPRLQD